LRAQHRIGQLEQRIRPMPQQPVEPGAEIDQGTKM
jgi:hypothetical protein